MKSKNHPNRGTANRLIQSYSSGLIHGVTRGKTIAAKHFLLGLGLHNITGQKVPIQIVNHLGHCIDYKLVCEIETVRAKAAENTAKSSGALVIKLISLSHSVLTYFWVDNFDMNLETKTGHGAINSTHMVAFREESPLTIAGVCSTGSLNSVLMGSNYNCAWTAHGAFSEARLIQHCHSGGFPNCSRSATVILCGSD